jgi:precorrin-6A/cobalt-precorrin-6A reductase
LFARILPSPTALEAVLAAGFTPDRIIALRPPITAELEVALWRQWQITQVITKASGQAGGEDRKQAIAAKLGVRLIRIARPAIAYPKQTDSLDTAIEFALRYCG